MPLENKVSVMSYYFKYSYRAKIKFISGVSNKLFKNTRLYIFITCNTKKNKLFIASNSKETNVADTRETTAP